MAALTNGTYYISSNIFGGERFYLTFRGEAPTTELVIDTFKDSATQQWDVRNSSIPNIYTFRNRQHQTYITFISQGDQKSNISSSSSPGYWYLTTADWGYAVGIDKDASYVWNVEGGEAAVEEAPGTKVILYAFDRREVSRNEYWKFYPIQEWSEMAPTTSSSSELPSSTPASTSTTPAQEGIDVGDKIGLGVGLGVGIPTLIVAIIALFMVKKH